MLSRPALIYPADQDCPMSMAEAIYDVRYGIDTLDARKRIRNRWGTIDYFFMAAESLYETNSWTFDRREKDRLRKMYKAKD